MMQLLCKGVSLDLYDDTNIQFTHDNPLFAFDKLACERTTQFKLPATKKNDKVFALARVPEYTGEAMRRRYDAQLQMSGVTRNGYLYISEWNGEEYAAIFVAGELVDVQRFGNYEWGSLPLNYTVNQIPYAANAADVPMIARVKYHTDVQAEADHEPCQPSIDIHELLKAVNDNGLLPISGLTGQHFRLIRNTPHEVHDVKVTLSNNQAGSTTLNMDIGSDSPVINADGVITTGMPQGEPWESTKAFEVQLGSKITFPANTPANLCLCTSFDRASGECVYIEFVGGRGFHKANGQIVYYGTPLAGRTITLPNGSRGRFVLMTADAAAWSENDNEPFFYWDRLYVRPGMSGGTWDDVPDYSIDVRFTGANEDNVYYYNNSLPAIAVLQDLKLGDMLKLYSCVTGTLINVTPTGIEFVAQPSGISHELNVISTSNVARTFSNFGQKTFVRFKDDEDNVKNYEREIVTYTIDNVNLDEEKTLIELDATEGGVYTEGGTDYEDNVLVVRGCENEEDEYWEAKELKLPNNVVAQMGTGEWLERAPLTKSTYIQRLCNVSTQVKMSARMSFLAYCGLRVNDFIYFKGSEYVFTTRQWQKNVAKFTLSKA